MVEVFELFDLWFVDYYGTIIGPFYAEWEVQEWIEAQDD